MYKLVWNRSKPKGRNLKASWVFTSLSPYLGHEKDRLLVKVEKSPLIGGCEINRHPEARHRAHTSAVHPLVQDFSVQQHTTAPLLPLTERQEEIFRISKGLLTLTSPCTLRQTPVVSYRISDRRDGCCCLLSHAAAHPESPFLSAEEK